MRNKKNVYKRKIHFRKIFNNISSVLFTFVIASFFCFLGYSVARPFAAIGEIESDSESSQTPLKEFIEPLENTEESEIRAYWLDEKEFDDPETLEKSVKSIPDSYNTVVVPLKMKGGKLNFKSVNEDAEMAGANSEISLSEILDIVKAENLIPAASVNIMEDNLYPKVNNQAGFLSEKTHKIWLDASEKKGGKPWINPASSAAREYSASIVGEITQAGFKYVIGTNAEYPQFSQEALDTIGERVKDENRYLDLIDIVNDMADSADRKGSEMWLEISAYDLFTDNCEVFEKMLLNTTNTVIKIDLSEFNSKVKCGSETIDFSKMSVKEKIIKVCELTETYIYKTSFIPEVTDKNLSSTQIKAVEETFEEIGFTSYIVN
ncbi:MAG: putative glycoside hydrolase [Porcipelethomonas sp.]